MAKIGNESKLILKLAKERMKAKRLNWLNFQLIRTLTPATKLGLLVMSMPTVSGKKLYWKWVNELNLMED